MVSKSRHSRSRFYNQYIIDIYPINIPVFRKNESLILITGSETISCEEQHDETPIRISVNDFDVPYKDCLCWFRGLQL